MGQGEGVNRATTWSFAPTLFLPATWSLPALIRMDPMKCVTRNDYASPSPVPDDPESFVVLVSRCLDRYVNSSSLCNRWANSKSAASCCSLRRESIPSSGLIASIVSLDLSFSRPPPLSFHERYARTAVYPNTPARKRRAEHETAVDVLCCCCGTHRQSRWFFTAIVSDVPTDVLHEIHHDALQQPHLAQLSIVLFACDATPRAVRVPCPETTPKRHVFVGAPASQRTGCGKV